MEKPETKLTDFRLASDIPMKESNDKPMKKPPANIQNLRAAIESFKYSVDATKLDDIGLDGANVAALFRRDSDNVKFVVMYKREFYIYFSRHFMHVPDQGYGVLANHKLVHWAAMNGHKIASVFPDGRCYSIDALEFLRYYEEYETECPRLPGEIATPLSKWTRLY